MVNTESGRLVDEHMDSVELTVERGVLTCFDGIVERCLVVDLGCILRFGTAGWEIAGLQSGGFAHGTGRDAEGEGDGYESNSGG